MSNTGVQASLFYSGNTWYHSAGLAGEGGSTEVAIDVGKIEFGTFYSLDLFIDENRNICSKILDESEEIISTIQCDPVPDLEYGIVGIGSESDVIFDNFILNAQLYACYGDLNHDLDVDGLDVAAYISDFINIGLEDFAEGFGRTDCPLGEATYKIGLSVALTGPTSADGIPYSQGIEDYFNAVNDSGMLGQDKIDCLIRDDGYSLTYFPHSLTKIDTKLFIL